MIQLAFESAYDPFHAAFRLLRPFGLYELKSLQIRRLKILDVFVAEPRRCLEIRVPPTLKKSARQASECQRETYGRRPSTNALFDRMGPMQDAAIQTLVMQGVLDADAYSVGQAARSEFPLADGIAKRIERANFEQTALMKFLYSDLSEFPLEGAGGLKDRTGLGEFRYDLV